MVSGSALCEADATGIEIEPRTFKEKMVIALTVFAVASSVAFGVWYLTKSRKDVLDDQLLTDAHRSTTRRPRTSSRAKPRSGPRS